MCDGDVVTLLRKRLDGLQVDGYEMRYRSLAPVDQDLRNEMTKVPASYDRYYAAFLPIIIKCP